jgi:glycosyltransferase involved in cell wall biosynthesis
MDERTRVAVVITKLTAGAGVVALNGALALDPRRFVVTLYYGSGDRLASQAARAGLRTVHLEHMAADIAPREDARGVRELAAHLSGGFDVVHTHSAKAGAIGRLAAKRVGIPVVHTLHGFPFHDFQPAWRRNLYIDIERRLGRSTDVFLAVGSSVAAEAIRLGIAPPDRVRVIMSSVDTSIQPATAASRAAARDLLGLPHEALVVGTVGRLDFQKAPDHFVEAARRVRDPRVRYVWVGSGELEAEARRLAIRRGLGNRMLFTGERDDVPALLPAFDVFAMSSRYEGIPCALAEAMLAGIPAVATAVNGVPEIVVPGETGLLARAGDPVSLARAIEHALARPEERRRWAVEARRLVVDRWAPSELALVLESSYIDAVSHHAVAHSKVLLPFPQVAPLAPESAAKADGRRAASMVVD